MKKIGLSTLAVLAVAGSSYAVGGVNLDLTLVGRTAGAAGVLPWSAASKGVSVNTSGAAATIRFEVRFAFSDSNTSDNITYAGLAGVAFDVRSTIGTASGATIGFARYLTADNNDGAPARDGIVNSGTLSTGAAQGLPNAYRPNVGNLGVLGGNAGFLGTTTNNPVIPLSISTPSNTPIENERYFVYAFNITLPAGFAAGSYTVSLANLDQASIFYAIDDAAGELGVIPFDLVRSSSSSVKINVVPAPGAAALLGLGGLMAARRRRN